MSLQHFIPAENIAEKTFSAPERAARHIAKVLRLTEGETIVIFDGVGNRWRARLDFVRDGEVSGVLLEKLPPLKQASPEIILRFAPVSRQAVEQLLDQCAQLGCAAFSPVKTARTQFDITPRWTEKAERLRELLINTCEQCGAAQLPRLLPPQTFAEAVQTCGPALLATQDALPIAASCNKLLAQNPGLKTLSVFVGPEGGFTGEEIALARAHNIALAGLGLRVLRAETACAAACFALSNL